jgi:hypothetical protein
MSIHFLTIITTAKMSALYIFAGKWDEAKVERKIQR